MAKYQILARKLIGPPGRGPKRTLEVKNSVATPPRVRRTAAAWRSHPPAQRAAHCRTLRAARPANGTVAARSYSAAVRTLQCRPFFFCFSKNFLRQSALEELMNLQRTESPQHGGRSNSDGKRRRHVADDGRRVVVAAEGEGSTRSVLGKCVYLVTLAMSLFDLQDVCIAIGSIATLDLPMVVDLIGIYGLKGPYCTLTTTDWFLQALSVIPRGSWGDVARRFTMIHWAGITDSACKNQLVMVSVQYGPFNTYIPIRSTTIGTSRVARDPITMHTSRRSNSDIASVTR
ncbi:hypothetical protein F511_09342 [Dorcoceras hygrometricum]|uniref:Acyl-CoA dehydrogenase-related protein n=1 Tax=Dorcoceras hygrometricum TaxID=472368 RepID=A0A2Z7BVI5_9LAMI|nr:hypothetical protein F511_09342 [Dorcoceras hygrometricum]